jgi:hypothetical protein
MGLITRLRDCKELESAWYFNCSVYGKTFDEKRIKFDMVLYKVTVFCSSRIFNMAARANNML